MRLTRQHIPGLQVGGPEREVLIHHHGAVQQPGAAGAAGATHARVGGGVTADLQRGFQDRVPGGVSSTVACCPDKVKVTVAEAWSRCAAACCG